MIMTCVQPSTHIKLKIVSVDFVNVIVPAKCKGTVRSPDVNKSVAPPPIYKAGPPNGQSLMFFNDGKI